jgi:hypothetical protein
MQAVARAATVAAVSALALVLVFASPVQAAAPKYILVSGPRLERPILLDNWDENLALLVAVDMAPRARGSAVRGLARRPKLDLALFWVWAYDRPPTLPSKADQHDSFYPAHRSKPPIIVFTANGRRIPRLVPTRALRILARHHVPLRL